MIKELKKIDEQAMLKEWALAETVSIRRWKYLEDVLPPEILSKVQQEHFELSEDEWQKLVKMIRNFRAPLLDGFLRLKIEWYEGKVPLGEIQELKIMNWQPFVDLAESRKLVDLARAFRTGKMPPSHHEFAENLDRIRKDLRLETMKGKPILVSRNENPPYMLIEGFTRLSALLMNILEGKSYGEELPIILGISKRLDEWYFY